MNPSFVLAGPTGAVLAEGVRNSFSEIADAQAALRAGTPLVLGALPFDLTAPAALYEPETVAFTDALPAWPASPPPAVVDRETLPPGPVHRGRVAEAIRQLRDPQIPIDKVVLARALRLTADSPWDVRSVLRRLADADPAATVYLADLSPAGGAHAGTALAAPADLGPRPHLPLLHCRHLPLGGRAAPAAAQARPRARRRHRP